VKTRLELALTRLFGGDASGDPTVGDHAARLEAELSGRLGDLYPRREEHPVEKLAWRAAFACAVVLALAGASQVPADHAVRIGIRVTVRSDAPLGPEVVRSVAGVIEASGTAVEVRVRGVREGTGPVLTAIEVFGGTVEREGLAGAIRAAVPALAALPVEVEPIERTVAGDLGDRVRHLVGMDRVPADELRRLIEEELRAAEPGAQVNVRVEDGEGTREVRVEVKKEAEPAAPPR
jgi:hypothetical protein